MRLLSNIMNGNSLRSKVLSGSLWLSSFEILRHVCQLVITIILARLLDPKDFGLIAMAMVFIGAVDNISELGIKSSLVQKKGDISDYIDTAWTIQLIRGSLIFLSLSLAAPLIATFFNEPMLKLIVPILAFKPIFVGLQNPAAVYFLKEMDFRKQFTLQISGIIIQMFLVIPLAFILRNVWVLVVGSLAVSGGRLVTSYYLKPYCPKPRIVAAKAAEMLHFGKWILSEGIVYILLRNIPSILVGKVLNTASLGVYRVADKLGGQPAFLIRHIANKVLYPAYAVIQDDLNRLKQNYKRVLEITLSLIIPVTVGGYLLREPIVIYTIGPKWTSAIEPFGILLIAGSTYLLVLTSFPLFMAIGLPKLNFSLRTITTACMLLCIYPSLKIWNLNGVAASILFANVFTIPIWMYLLYKHIGLGLIEFIKILSPIFFGTAVMGAVVVFLVSFAKAGILGLILLIIIGAVVFFLMMFGFWKLFKSGPIKEISTILNFN